VKPLTDYFGKTKADKITARDVERFISWRKGQKSVKTRELITADTVNKELSVLSRIFRRLKKSGCIQSNPADDVERLSANAPTFHVITPGEEKIYLPACPPLLQDVATLMIEGGFRCGEVYNLEKKDFHPEKNFVQIASGKTKAARRRVYLTEKAKAVLIRRAENFNGVYLFPHFDKDGNPPTKSLSYVHAEVIQRLGFSFRIYDARHTFASRAVESGIDLVTLAAILGHTNLKMLTRYCHPSEANKHDAILRMEKLAKAV
jgi:integrase